jgi:hypothetical protein
MDDLNEATYLDIEEAIENLDIARLNRLLEENAQIDLNEMRYGGWTLLDEAIDTEVDYHQSHEVDGPIDFRMSAALISQGADPYRTHGGGRTSADLAAELRHAGLIGHLSKLRHESSKPTQS